MKKIIFLLQLLFITGLLCIHAEPIVGILDDVKMFEKAAGGEKVKYANAFLSKLYNEKFIDKLNRYNEQTPVDTLAKNVYFAATEYAFYELANYQMALHYGVKALDLLERSKEIKLQGDCESILAIVYFRQSDFGRALKHAHSDLDIQRRLKEPSSISSALNTIAGIYMASRREKEAYEYIKQAIQYSTEAKDTARMAIQRGMASEILFNLNRYEEAIALAKEAYRLDSIKGNEPKMAIRLSQLASPYIKLKAYDKAEKVLKQAVPLLEKYKIGVSLAICRNQLGLIANHKQQYKEAEQYYTLSLAYFKEHNDLYNESKALKGLYIAIKESRPREAMALLERLAIVKDSLYDKEMNLSISQAHAKYKNEELKLQGEQQQNERRLWQTTSGLVVLVLLAVVLFMVYRFRMHKHQVEVPPLVEREEESLEIGDEHEVPVKEKVLSGEDGVFIAQVNEFIDMHIEESIEVEKLANHLCISAKKLNRKLSAIVGCNTITYIIHRRVDHACDKLIHTDMRISDVAFACGFDNPSNFARTFKYVHGCSPSNYRKEYASKELADNQQD